MFACIHISESRPDALFDLANGISPRVERTAPDTAILALDGLEGLLGALHQIGERIVDKAAELNLAARVGMGANPEVAWLAARGFPGITVIPAGEEAARLGLLPISLLDPSPRLEEILIAWGVRTCGDLTALPPTGLAERMGEEGIHLWKKARGEWERPLVPYSPASEYSDRFELEHPLTLLEPLSFVLSRLLIDLCARLRRQSLATHDICLDLELEEAPSHTRNLRLPFPMEDHRTLLRLLQLDLEFHPPHAPVRAVSLTLHPVKPRRFQRGLFLPLAPEPDKLELTLTRITGLVGEENAGSPELLNTHRPGAFRMTRFTVESTAPQLRLGKPQRRTNHQRHTNQQCHTTSHPIHKAQNGRHSHSPRREPWVAQQNTISSTRAALEINMEQTSPVHAPIPRLCHSAFRVFRPPLEAQVKLQDGFPSQVRTARIYGKVLSLAGPWRSSGDWWTDNPWSRDDWDVLLGDGAMYRLIYDFQRAAWFVEGAYD